MYKVKHSLTSVLIVKNSKFITLIYPLDSLDDVEELLKKAKALYPKATHYTYAYRTFEGEKSNDDGEPGGTAGMPILNVIKRKNIINVLVIVIRYFGGIKLGAGGLSRAYSTSCAEALEKCFLVLLVPAKKVKIITEYSHIKELDYLLQNDFIVEKEFADVVTYIALLRDEHILDYQFAYNIIGDDYMEKEL